MRCCAVLTRPDLLILPTSVRLVAGFLLLVSLTSSAMAGTHKRGPYTLDDHAYPDATVQVSGPAWAENSPHWLDPTGPHCVTPAVGQLLLEGWEVPFEIYGIVDLRSDIVLEVRFLNNTIANLAGPDVVIFQTNESRDGSIPVPGGYMVAVQNGVGGFTDFRSYPGTLSTPINAPFAYIGCGPGESLYQRNLSVITIDLSDFGVEEGAAITHLRFYTPDNADPVAIAALQLATVPVAPTSWGKVKSTYR